VSGEVKLILPIMRCRFSYMLLVENLALIWLTCLDRPSKIQLTNGCSDGNMHDIQQIAMNTTG
jgi:hypothetical protein